MTSPRPINANVEQILAWKKAVAAHNRGQRNRRGKRPAKPVVGIRWKPPEDAA